MFKGIISFSNICSKNVRDNCNEYDYFEIHQGVLREDNHDYFTHDSWKARYIDGLYQEGDFGLYVTLKIKNVCKGKMHESHVRVNFCNIPNGNMLGK
jgi:hypothetical protein